MPKCDLRVALRLFEIALQHGYSLVNLLHIFRTLFPKNTPGRLLLKISSYFVSVYHCYEKLKKII